ncbi:MAG: tetratricopeptide repeat protein [Chloroflexi bacterium]|nr:tetratricopeptide repeat protein [Chloroflexota bacterium]
MSAWHRAPLILLLAVAAPACANTVFERNEEANALLDGGRHAEALAIYRELQLAHPDLPELDYNAGNALYLLQSPRRAVRDLEKALLSEDLERKTDVYYNLGNALARSGNLVQARQAYKEALKRTPGDLDSKFNLEIVNRLLQGQPPTPSPAEANPQGQEPPPGSPPPGGTTPPGPQPSGGQPSPDSPPGGTPGEGQPEDDVQSVLREVGPDMSIEDALRLLDALRGRDRGVDGIQFGSQPGRRPGDRDW